MHFFIRALFGALAGVVAAIMAGDAGASSGRTIQGRFAEVNGTRLHYLVAGAGKPMILLHGYAQTSHMWRPLIAELAKTHTVIAPDLRGFGQSAKPRQRLRQEDHGADIHALAASLGYQGQDRRPRHRADGRLRLRCAISRGSRPHRADGCVPARRRRLDEGLAAARPLAFPLLWRRRRWSWSRAASASISSTSGTTSPPTARIRLGSRPPVLCNAYAQPGAMRAGFEVFRAFEQDAKDFAGFAEDQADDADAGADRREGGRPFLIDQGRLVADNVKGVIITGSGHWLIDEAPDQVIPKLLALFAN